jgi:histidinol-phosphate aminotransferase
VSGPVPRPGILHISPYVVGKSSIRGVERVIRLASNESALGPSPRAVEAYQETAQRLHRYPDGGSEALRDALGEAHGLEPAGLICGNGSDELLDLLARAYAGPGDEVLYSAHGFLMYPIAALSVGATPVVAPEPDRVADVDALLDALTPRTRLVYLANPNNPTGTYLPAAELARLHRGLPDDVVLVIDAAYAEFVEAADYSAGIDIVEAGENVVMTRTFSKIHGLAALRLGWAYGPAAVIDVLHRIRSPFNVTAPAQAAGLAALRDSAWVEAARRHNTRWREWFSERLRALGLLVPPSVCNFVLIEFPPEPGRDASSADAFLQARGIIARDVSSYGLPNILRISIGTEEEMRTAADAFSAFME